MSHPENPLTNLDLWCEWTGDPNDAVEVGFAVNVSIPTTTYPLICSTVYMYILTDF
jgi:hypothetical protein